MDGKNKDVEYDFNPTKSEAISLIVSMLEQYTELQDMLTQNGVVLVESQTIVDHRAYRERLIQNNEKLKTIALKLKEERDTLLQSTKALMDNFGFVLAALNAEGDIAKIKAPIWFAGIGAIVKKLGYKEIDVDLVYRILILGKAHFSKMPKPEEFYEKYFRDSYEMLLKHEIISKDTVKQITNKIQENGAE
jgi:hypothetical protein